MKQYFLPFALALPMFSPLAASDEAAEPGTGLVSVYFLGTDFTRPGDLSRPAPGEPRYGRRDR